MNDKDTKEEKIKNFLIGLDTISDRIIEFDISDKITSFIKNNFHGNVPDVLLWEKIAFDFIELRHLN